MGAASGAAVREQVVLNNDEKDSSRSYTDRGEQEWVARVSSGACSAEFTASPHDKAPSEGSVTG